MTRGSPSLSTQSSRSAGIVVLDDLFPHAGSSFRLEEFCRYLETFPDLSVRSSGAALAHAAEARPIEAVIAEHLRDHPEHEGRVLALEPGPLPRADLYYCVFFHLVSAHLEAIEASGSPFAFTLYPGGGLALGEAAADSRLRRILGSPWCRGVLVTQAALRDHLVGNRLVEPARVSLVHGGVCPPEGLPAPPPKVRYGEAKCVFDLCFFANRYTPTGTDKGYDLFVAAARALVAMGRDMRFHVIGPFDATILDLGEAAGRFTFHGLQPIERMRALSVGFDAILSPTRPGVLHPGAFDGFPTGCTILAGLAEVAMICTDALGLNRDYEPGRDLVLVHPEVNDIVATLVALLDDPARVARFGLAARRRLLELFSPQVQMAPRIELLRRWAGRTAGSV